MTNNIDTRVKIAESDLLAALTGIVNAHLSDGIADSSREVHQLSVVIWRNMPTPGAAIHGRTSLAVIVHVDGVSVAPFAGSTVVVALDSMSHAATQVVVRAERLAAEELDRREETLKAQLDTAQDELDAKLETLAEHDERVVAQAIAHEASIPAVKYAEGARENGRKYGEYGPRELTRYAGESVIYAPTPVSGDELARVRAGVSA